MAAGIDSFISVKTSTVEEGVSSTLGSYGANESPSLPVSIAVPHKDGSHLLVLDGGKFTCVSVSNERRSNSFRLCFDQHSNTLAERLPEEDAGNDHGRKIQLPALDIDHCSGANGGACSVATEQPSDCCEVETVHVHAHVHHKSTDLTEEVTMEQCKEEDNCALPMPWSHEQTACARSSSGDSDEEGHMHREGCGHNQIPHGDHMDWLVGPLDDGSYLLHHPHLNQDGEVSHFHDHGRLIRIGSSGGTLRRRHPLQVLTLFNYIYPGDPSKAGFQPLKTSEADWDGQEIQEVDRPIDRTGLESPCCPMPYCLSRAESADSMNLDPDMGLGGSASFSHNCSQTHSRNPSQKLKACASSKNAEAELLKLEKTVMNVMGICCPSEVPLIKKILEPVPGVVEVVVNVPARKTTVIHDPAKLQDWQLVALLNEAQMDASIFRRDAPVVTKRWPKWNVWVCGLLTVIAWFHYMYEPLEYVGLGCLVFGWFPILRKAFAALKRGVMDINFLMSVAIVGAVWIGEYEEAGSVIFLFLIANWLEMRSADRARAAIASVMEIKPQSATLSDTGMTVPVENVKVGEHLDIKPGEMIPIDGSVIQGTSAVDESSLTGESVPVPKEEGMRVLAGTVNLNGYLKVQTESLSEDSTVAKMMRLVEEAQSRSSPTEKMIEKFAKYYTPVVVFGAVLLIIIPLALRVRHAYKWVELALFLLVTACPCALVISTPVATVCAITKAAKMGILIKGGAHLEAIGNLTQLAMDKTGTISEGRFRVQNVSTTDPEVDVDQLLYWLSSAESQSNHPMASALVAYARLRGIEPSSRVKNVEYIAGQGVSAVVDDHTVQIGNRRMVERMRWMNDDAEKLATSWERTGGTVCWIGLDQRLIGMASVCDYPRAEAAEAIRNLQAIGVRVSMLTGDNAGSAQVIREKIGVHELEVFAALLPEDKARLVGDLKANGITGMVGDGINDAPALAAAHVGIAMGVAGTAAAMESADVALMTNDLRQLARLVRLAKKCKVVVYQNITLAVTTKVLVFALALSGFRWLWMAVLADVGTSLAVTLNSMLLLKGKKTAGHSHGCKKSCGGHGGGKDAVGMGDHQCSAAGGKDINLKCFDTQGLLSGLNENQRACSDGCCGREDECCADARLSNKTDSTADSAVAGGRCSSAEERCTASMKPRPGGPQVEPGVGGLGIKAVPASSYGGRCGVLTCRHRHADEDHHDREHDHDHDHVHRHQDREHGHDHHDHDHVHAHAHSHSHSHSHSHHPYHHRNHQDNHHDHSHHHKCSDGDDHHKCGSGVSRNQARSETRRQRSVERRSWFARSHGSEKRSNERTHSCKTPAVTLQEEAGTEDLQIGQSLAHIAVSVPCCKSGTCQARAASTECGQPEHCMAKAAGVPGSESVPGSPGKRDPCHHDINRLVVVDQPSLVEYVVNVV